MATDETRHGPGDPYSRVDYRRLIAWEKRVEREAPFLRELLARAPVRRVLDLGCGTGEHVAFFAREGAVAVGVDRSQSMLDAAREHETRGEGRFLLGSAEDAPALLAGEPAFGLAICLGNMLPHVREDAELEALVRAAHAVLAPGGLLLVQILNYHRILARGERHLPLDFRPGDAPAEARDDHLAPEIVFLRLLRPAPGGRVLFFPTTLVVDPADEEHPVRVDHSRRVELRAWTAEDLRPVLEGAGLEVTLAGDMSGGAFDPEASRDLVVVARRPEEGPRR